MHPPNTVDQQDAPQEENESPLTAENMRQWGVRLNHAFGPVAAGMVIDTLDFVTFGPIGLVIGAPIGGLAGYWMARALRLDRTGVLFCTIGAAVYCMVPFTEFIPLGTLVGACVRLQTADDEADHEPPAEQSDNVSAGTQST